jgi:hypothetical protein
MTDEAQMHDSMVADLRLLQFVVFSFCRDEKTTKVVKTTKLGQKDDKHNPLISDLICRLFDWRFVVLSPLKDDRTTRRQNDNTENTMGPKSMDSFG